MRYCSTRIYATISKDHDLSVGDASRQPHRLGAAQLYKKTIAEFAQQIRSRTERGYSVIILGDGRQREIDAERDEAILCRGLLQLSSPAAELVP